MHHVGEEADHLSLHLVGVDLEIAVVEGVPDVVGDIPKERQQGRVVEVLIARIAHEPRAQLLEVPQQPIEPLFRLSLHLTALLPM